MILVGSNLYRLCNIFGCIVLVIIFCLRVWCSCYSSYGGIARHLSCLSLVGELLILDADSSLFHSNLVIVLHMIMLAMVL